MECSFINDINPLCLFLTLWDSYFAYVIQNHSEPIMQEQQSTVSFIFQRISFKSSVIIQPQQGLLWYTVVRKFTNPPKVISCMNTLYKTRTTNTFTQVCTWFGGKIQENSSRVGQLRNFGVSKHFICRNRGLRNCTRNKFYIFSCTFNVCSSNIRIWYNSKLLLYLLRMLLEKTLLSSMSAKEVASKL